MCFHVHVYTFMYITCMYMNTQLRHSERQTKQHNTTQTLRQLFSKEKELHLRWDSNPCLTHSRRDALPTELPRQLSWLNSNQQSKTKQTRTCTCVHACYMYIHVYMHVTSASLRTAVTCLLILSSTAVCILCRVIRSDSCE